MHNLMSLISNPRLRAMVALCQKEVPGFNIHFKDELWWWKLVYYVGFVWLFNPKFLTNYITTFGSGVHFPNRAKFLDDPEAATDILAHELVHMVDKRQNGFFKHELAYAMPQVLTVLAVFSLGAIWHLGFLVFLVFLLALVPWPAIWRKDIEMRGYTMSAAVFYWRWGVYGDDQFEKTARQFSGPAYYFMWPWHAKAKGELMRRFEAVKSGEILQEKVFRDVYEIVKPK